MKVHTSWTLLCFDRSIGFIVLYIFSKKIIFSLFWSRDINGIGSPFPIMSSFFIIALFTVIIFGSGYASLDKKY